MRQAKREQRREQNEAEAERRCAMCWGPGRPQAVVCSPCAHWWYYHNLQTAAEYGRYIGKVERAHVRVQKRGSRARLRAVR